MNGSCLSSRRRNSQLCPNSGLSKVLPVYNQPRPPPLRQDRKRHLKHLRQTQQLLRNAVALVAVKNLRPIRHKPRQVHRRPNLIQPPRQNLFSQQATTTSFACVNTAYHTYIIVGTNIEHLRYCDLLLQSIPNDTTR